MENTAQQLVQHIKPRPTGDSTAQNLFRKPNMIYRITHEDGPCAWNCTEDHVEAKSLVEAAAFFEQRFPRSMIITIDLVDSSEDRPYNTYIANKQ